MNITSYSREQIAKGISKAKEKQDGPNDHIRLLFAPERINEDNFDRACDIYSRLDMSNYDTVVVVESYDEKLDKKLPMCSNATYSTSLGEVPVNDYMRNEFCDEDDDFFIHDEAFNEDISLFQQLMFLQTISDDFKALGIQIADPDPSIVKEIGYVLEEVLASRSALIVFCCDLDNDRKEEFSRVVEMIEDKNESALMNYLNSGDSHIDGTTAFIAGILVANKWELDLNFLGGEYDDYSGSLLTAYADRQRVVF
ncbi:AmmeMemoRadiSam system protein B [Fodinibius halophilus]|uniref:AmmeMemoRadiSam system protein B n=1 Tax=Fodinibius halophilus TaxID=1736908 RepID=A0A6M1T2Z9_9BACT|nr:AmmeMemoRadiSam system protein B [Fodinibius halophilus]NGP89846.1 AmmeMemoRadiSam system protein B [Fodinibius halophilus]